MSSSRTHEALLSLRHARDGLDMSHDLLNYVMFGFVVPKMLDADKRVVQKAAAAYEEEVVPRYGDCYIEIPEIFKKE